MPNERSRNRNVKVHGTQKTDHGFVWDYGPQIPPKSHLGKNTINEVAGVGGLAAGSLVGMPVGALAELGALGLGAAFPPGAIAGGIMVGTGIATGLGVKRVLEKAKAGTRSPRVEVKKPYAANPKPKAKGQAKPPKFSPKRGR